MNRTPLFSGSYNADMEVNPRVAMLYYFCRMQMPRIELTLEGFSTHIQRTYQVFVEKQPNSMPFSTYLETMYAQDWYLCIGCLERQKWAWERLFTVKAGRSDALLMDALRTRAHRLYPRDEERQENAVHEFYSMLLVPESERSIPILARYDGQRPLTPWLIRIFQNWHVSKLRSHGHTQALPDDDISLPIPPRTETRWHEAFITAARAWLDELDEQELLLLGLRWRYRFSQRDIASRLKVHEGTISRQTDKLRDHCLEKIGKELTSQGWNGDDLEEYILTEMAGVLIDEPRLGIESLGKLLAKKGIKAE